MSRENRWTRCLVVAGLVVAALELTSGLATAQTQSCVFAWARIHKQVSPSDPRWMQTSPVRNADGTLEFLEMLRCEIYENVRARPYEPHVRCGGDLAGASFPKTCSEPCFSTAEQAWQWVRRYCPDGSVSNPNDRFTLPPADPPAPDVSGPWKGRYYYLVAQNGADFNWVVINSYDQVGRGRLGRGDAIAAGWQSVTGRSDKNGRVSRRDGSGRAVEIAWQDGEIWRRGPARDVMEVEAERGTERQDLSYFFMSRPDRNLCRASCEVEEGCRTWAFVPPDPNERRRVVGGVDVPMAMCRMNPTEAARGARLVPVVNLSNASEAWAREWVVTASARDIANAGRPLGFYPRAERIGDANPSPGRSGVLYLHPPSRSQPAAIERQVTLGASPTLRLGVAANQGDADWVLLVKVNGRPLSAARTIAGAAGWQDLRFDLSRWANQKVTITIEAQADEWWYEYAFFDYIELDGQLGTDVAPETLLPPEVP